MGYNTTLVILNDSLNCIEEDANFGKKVANAIRAVLGKGKPIDICSGFHANAASVIETHHADEMKIIAVGGNCGEDLGYVGGYRATQLDMLKSLADRLGYRIAKKPAKTFTVSKSSTKKLSL